MKKKKKKKKKLNKIVRTHTLLRVLIAEVFAEAFAIRTNSAAKFKLKKNLHTRDTNAHCRRPCHGHKSKDSVYVHDGRSVATIFVLSYRRERFLSSSS